MVTLPITGSGFRGLEDDFLTKKSSQNTFLWMIYLYLAQRSHHRAVTQTYQHYKVEAYSIKCIKRSGIIVSNHITPHDNVIETSAKPRMQAKTVKILMKMLQNI